jgi:hypothetical protein
MKTSDKLILGAILCFVGLIAVVEGVLHSKYRSGDYLTATDLHHEEYVQFHQPAPSVLMLDGTIWVNLVPADSFYFEFPVHPQDPEEAGYFAENATPDGKVLRYKRSGDTLFINGNYHKPVHRAFFDKFYLRELPQVYIYGRAFREIGVTNGQVWLQGTDDSAIDRTARLSVTNATLWVGNYSSYGSEKTPEYFDSLDIGANNSVIVLNRPARIGKLSVRLADSSVLYDEYAGLRDAEVGYDDGSSVNLTGRNIKKIALNHHP